MSSVTVSTDASAGSGESVVVKMDSIVTLFGELSSPSLAVETDGVVVDISDVIKPSVFVSCGVVFELATVAGVVSDPFSSFVGAEPLLTFASEPAPGLETDGFSVVLSPDGVVTSVEELFGSGEAVVGGEFEFSS